MQPTQEAFEKQLSAEADQDPWAALEHRRVNPENWATREEPLMQPSAVPGPIITVEEAGNWKETLRKHVLVIQSRGATPLVINRRGEEVPLHQEAYSRAFTGYVSPVYYDLVGGDEIHKPAMLQGRRRRQQLPRALGGPLHDETLVQAHQVRHPVLG